MYGAHGFASVALYAVFLADGVRLLFAGGVYHVVNVDGTDLFAARAADAQVVVNCDVIAVDAYLGCSIFTHSVAAVLSGCSSLNDLWVNRHSSTYEEFETSAYKTDAKSKPLLYPKTKSSQV